MTDQVVTSEAISTAINEILSGADLTTLSSKQARQALEKRFGLSLLQRREEIDTLLMRAIADKMADGERLSGPEANDSTCNAYSSESDSQTEENDCAREVDPKPLGQVSELSSDSDDSSDSDNGDHLVNEEDDKVLARRLQLEELGVRKRNVDKRSTKTKRAGKRDDAHSVLKKKRSIKFTYSFKVLARKDVVSRMWKIFKERNLMDPKNRQYVLCDEQLEKVFKTKKFRAFGMMRILKTHIKDARLVQK